MPFQLVCKENNTDDFSLIFARGKCLDFLTQTKVTLGGEGTDCPIPGVAGVACTITGHGADYKVQIGDNDVPPLLNGQKISAQQLLHSGDTLRFPEHDIKFYLIFSKANTAKSVTLSAAISRQLAWYCLIFQVLFITVGMLILENGPFWDGQAKRLQIVKNIDALYAITQKNKLEDPVAAVLLNEIARDLGRRKIYLRQHLQDMPLKQRKQIAKDIDSLRIVADWLVTEKNILPPPQQLEIDAAIEKIISNNAFKD